MSILNALACPDDGSVLAGGDVPSCPACGRVFPVEDGVLRMLPADESGDAHAEVRAERRQRDREAAQYDRLLGLRLLSLAEIPTTLRPLGVSPGERVVEVGCGTGRLSLPLVRTRAACVLLDHSLDSLRVLQEKLPASDDVLLVQGDASRLPVRSGWATRLLSSQMLEHLPSPGLRERAVSEMARVLEPGGRLALSAYWHIPLLRSLLQKEGKHSGEIFFHRFDREDLRSLLEPHFRVERLTGKLLYVLLAHAVRG